MRSLPVNFPENKKPSLATRCIHPVRAAVIVILIFALLGLLGKSWWVFNLFSNFRLQYIALLLMAGTFLLFVNRLRLGLLCGTAALVLFLPLAHYYIPQAPVPHLAPLKVVSFNVNWCNKNLSKIRDFLSSESADVVLLVEANPDLANELQALATVYPFRLEDARDDNRGIIVLSKLPLQNGKIHSFGNVPYAEFAVNSGGETYHFVGVHTPSPLSAKRAATRTDELLAIAEAQRENPQENYVLMGDFNLTPFSRWYSDILHTGKLQDSLSGFGLSPTWMRGTIIFALPIDQMFLSSSLTVLQRSVGDNCGSDHNPLIAELAMKK